MCSTSSLVRSLTATSESEFDFPRLIVSGYIITDVQADASSTLNIILLPFLRRDSNSADGREVVETSEILCGKYNGRAPAPISTPEWPASWLIVVWPPCVGGTVTTCAVALRWDFGSYFCTSRGSRGYVWAERDLVRVFCGCKQSTIRHFLLFHFQCISGKPDHQVCPRKLLLCGQDLCLYILVEGVFNELFHSHADCPKKVFLPSFLENLGIRKMY